MSKVLSLVFKIPRIGVVSACRHEKLSGEGFLQAEHGHLKDIRKLMTRRINFHIHNLHPVECAILMVK